jgi:hypothetical protein
MISRHYLKKWPGVCVACLGLHDGSTWRGVVVFALPPRETAKRYGGLTWELARLWVDDEVPRNGESYFIGSAIRYIKRNNPEVKCLVSYADPSAGHTGVIYRAANWKPDGRTDEGRKTPRCDYVDAVSGKKYSRRSHIPDGREVIRVHRVSKFRYYYLMK